MTYQPKEGNMSAKWMITAAMVFLLTGCASSPVMPTAEERQALAPTGKLRVGFTFIPVQATKDPATGELKGPAIDLARELARRLQVPFEPVPYQTVVAMVNSASKGECDVYSVGINPDRARFMEFAAYSQTELGYLVGKSASIAAFSEVDRPGIRIVVLERGDSDILLTKSLKQATLVRTQTIDDSIAMVRSGKADAMAALKTFLFPASEQMPGSRILEGRLAVQEIAIGVPKGRETSMRYIRRFVDDLKAQGFIKESIDRAGVRGLMAAP
jgi:polar amino acid transport system substrate-binding protein